MEKHCPAVLFSGPINPLVPVSYGMCQDCHGSDINLRGLRLDLLHQVLTLKQGAPQQPIILSSDSVKGPEDN